MTDSEIELIWQSDSVIAVNKPAGLSTQAPGASDSLEIRLRRQLDRGGRYLAFPHRLDRVVSGVILVALTKKAARLLGAQFASRKTRKEYLAVVQGRFDAGQIGEQTWGDYLRKLDGQARVEICAESAPGAKRATTVVKTLETDPGSGQSRLQLRPITGRMHQLRVQTSSRGLPIVGDETYGAAKQHTDPACSGDEAMEQHRILLHAYRLEFHDPSNGRLVQVEASCPF